MCVSKPAGKAQHSSWQEEAEARVEANADKQRGGSTGGRPWRTSSVTPHWGGQCLSTHAPTCGPGFLCYCIKQQLSFQVKRSWILSQRRYININIPNLSSGTVFTDNDMEQGLQSGFKISNSFWLLIQVQTCSPYDPVRKRPSRPMCSTSGEKKRGLMSGVNTPCPQQIYFIWQKWKRKGKTIV